MGACEDCGNEEWVDWYVPHAVFNSVCPGGNGYLCLPCFGDRMRKQTPSPMMDELREAGYLDEKEFNLKEYSEAITTNAILADRKELVETLKEWKNQLFVSETEGGGMPIMEASGYNKCIKEVLALVKTK